MSELAKHTKKLFDLAQIYDFHKSFSQICFVERNLIDYSRSETRKISRKYIFNFEDFENRFEELLNCGHSWINLHFAGILKDKIFVIIEFPDYVNNIPREFVSINLSLPENRIIENKWKMLPFYEIVD